MQRIDVAALRGWITDGQEFSILDAREEGEFGTSHLFWAVPCPLSRREIRVPAMLPRKTVRVACMDDGRGLAEQLAGYLAASGYTNVHVLDGGTTAWAAAGNVLFSGVNVPSKAFGEWVEHHYGTESVDAPELHNWIAAGKNMVILDSRTAEEFARMTIPTARSVPGGELAYHIADIAPDPETLVVVNCAGRTRSIMGAESLRRAGIPNKVLALRNGTMGWELAGLTCDRGRADKFSAATPKTAALALQRAKNFAEESGVRAIGMAELEKLQADASRTLYVLDVRDPPEFRAGHLAGSRNSPGGQLVQATDSWIGVANARIVLVDDTGTRARMSAAWLRQMGHQDVFVLENAALTATAPAPIAIAAPRIGVPEFTKLLDSGDDTMVVDLARSIDFRDGHIQGAAWAVRTRLGQLASRLAGAKHVVLTCPDGSLAALAVDEARGLTTAEIRVLDGGTAAWRAAGRPLTRDRTTPADDDCIDFYLRAYDRNSGVEEAMRAYLSWEIDLAHEIIRDGTVHFGATAH